MPDKHREPVDEAEMIAPVREIENQRYIHHHTICACLRRIYQMTESEKIRMECRIAMAHSKAMHERLKHYKATYEPETPSGFERIDPIA